MLWSSIKFSLLYYNSLRKWMEVKLENLYVDVRAKKKYKDHWQLTRNLRSCGKKSLFGWQKYNWALTRKLQFWISWHLVTIFRSISILATKFTFVLADCFCPMWPSQKIRTNKYCKMFCKNIHNIIFHLKLAGKQEYSAWAWKTTFWW